MAHFYFNEKIHKSATPFWVWIAGCWNSSNILLMSCNLKNNCRLSRIFGDRFGGKDCGLYPYNPSAEEVGGLEVFLYEAAQNLELFKYSRFKK
jgi:hypothetical protein